MGLCPYLSKNVFKKLRKSYVLAILAHFKNYILYKTIAFSVNSLKH